MVDVVKGALSIVQSPSLSIDALPTGELTNRLQDILKTMPVELLGAQDSIIKEHVEILTRRLKVVDVGDLLNYFIGIGISSAELFIHKNPILKITLNGVSLALLLPMDRSRIEHALEIPLNKADFESYLNTQLINVSVAELEDSITKAIAFVIGHEVAPESVDSACLVSRNGIIIGYLTVFQTGVGHTGPDFRLYFEGYGGLYEAVREGGDVQLDAYDALLDTRMEELKAKWQSIPNTNPVIGIDYLEFENINAIVSDYMVLRNDLSDGKFRTYKRDLIYPPGYSELATEKQEVIGSIVDIWTQKKALLSVRHTDVGKRKFQQYLAYLKSEEVLHRNLIGTDLDENSTPNIYTFTNGSIRWIDLGYGGPHIDHLLREINRINSAI